MNKDRDLKLKADDLKFRINRRNFLGRSALASIGLGGMTHMLSNLRLMDRAVANITPDVVGNDYKALVCVFKRGGSDQNNMLVPVTGNSQKSNYRADRGIVAVPENAGEQNDPGQATIDGTTGGPADTYIGSPASVGEPFGLHPSCKNLKTMYAAGELAWIANCGTLAQVTTQADYLANAAILPVQLFSHSDQVTEWMAGSEPEKPFNSGWAGRVADLINSTANPDSETSMLITAAGNNNFMSAPGGSIPQYSVTDTGAISLTGYGNATVGPYGNAIDSGSGLYRTADPSNGIKNIAFRLQTFEDVMLYAHSHIIEEGYNTVVRRARANEALIGDALTTAAATGVNFNNFPNTDLGRELKMIAQLIAGRKCLGNKRQIFFVDQGGFDTHQDINNDQPALLSDFDSSIGAFNQAMKDIAGADGDFSYNDVVGFQASDFNRTWTPNGNDFGTSGTDHAWGTHVCFFGGPVNGGDFFGTFPTLAKGSPDDVSNNTNNSRGRWIPTTSVDQYSAVLAKWLGVAAGDINTIFPNLPNFPDPFDTSPTGPNLDLIDFTAT